jgi:hypothetical protein
MVASWVIDTSNSILVATQGSLSISTSRNIVLGATLPIVALPWLHSIHTYAGNYRMI